MIDILVDKKFLNQFDKGEPKNIIECKLPEGFVLRYEICTKDEFDLMDKKETVTQPVNNGQITYRNKAGESITVIDYENLIQSFPAQINTGKKAPKCCDFILYSESPDGFFICNELSESVKKEKWPQAREQFANTLLHLFKCDEIKKKIEFCKRKLCILSTTPEIVDSPDGQAAAFGIPYELMQKPEKLSYNPIEKRFDFEIWESNLIEYKLDKSVGVSMR